MNKLFSNPNDKNTIMRPNEYHGLNLKFDILRPLEGKSMLYLENSKNIGPGTNLVDRMVEEKNKTYKELTKDFTQAEKSSLLHDINYLKSENQQDIKNADERMSNKLLNNLSILKPIESINNLVYGSLIRSKEKIDNNLFDTTKKVTSYGEYDQLTDEEKKIIDERQEELILDGFGKKRKKRSKKGKKKK